MVPLLGAMLLMGCTSPSASGEASRSQRGPDAAQPKTTQASSGTRTCYLAVDGVVHVDGPCVVFSMGKDQYTLNTWDRGKPVQSHFAVVSQAVDGSFNVTWNADPDDDRALDPLGTVRLEEGCWVNERVRMCVK